MFRKLMTRPRINSLLLWLVFSAPLQVIAEVAVDNSDHLLLPAQDDIDARKNLPNSNDNDNNNNEGIIALSAIELEKLIGPIALYPDDLLAIVLPASTYPVDVILASRFLNEYEADDSIEPNEAWDESVVALLNYPEVLRMMDKEIDWAARLGYAVINQQADLIAAIETFRDRAYLAGNLETDAYQRVENNAGVIEITPVDEKVIYVPYYEPEKVIVYQTQPVYAYYPVPRPVYYYPYPVGYSFSYNRFWGVTTAFTIGWPDRYLNVHHRSYRGHPYYGHAYYGHYYRRPSISVYNTWYVHNSHHGSNRRHRDGDHWRSRNRHHRSQHNSTRTRNDHYAPNNRSIENSRNSDRDRQNTRTDRHSISDGQTITRNSNRTTRIRANQANSQPRVNDRNRNPATANARSTEQVRSGPRHNRDRHRSGNNPVIHFRGRTEADRVIASQGPDNRATTHTDSSPQRVNTTRSNNLSSYRSDATRQTIRVGPSRTQQSMTSRSSSGGRIIDQTSSQQTSIRPTGEPRAPIPSNSSRQTTRRQWSNPRASTRRSPEPQSTPNDAPSQQQNPPLQSITRSSRQSSNQNVQQSTTPQRSKPKRGRSRDRKAG
ncbi:MAG: DUF3300 domain-containing protein [Gammaproteobacteria bacterium]|nr:DUF3300 domain-containing protein [Gammaproteobacteria bacterium]MBT5203286.1 DUF3300 domain-containing protein [Gammaproteobacteria bacterium]MBT5603403.1 DUF3300 domain-containing protein [Gammaproteobacteria bacterium]